MKSIIFFMDAILPPLKVHATNYIDKGFGTISKKMVAKEKVLIEKCILNYGVKEIKIHHLI